MKRKAPMKRTPLRRTGPLKNNAGGLKRSAIKPKPRRGGPLPTEVREMAMRRNRGKCEAGISGYCTGDGSEFHHRQPRDRYNDTIENAAWLCSACHRYITDTSPSTGFRLGLRVSRHTTLSPAQFPMSVQGRWVYLNPDGTTSPATNPNTNN